MLTREEIARDVYLLYVQKLLGKMFKTGEEDNERHELDEHFLALHASTGDRRFPIKLESTGDQIGSCSITPEKHEAVDSFEIAESGTLTEWAFAEGYTKTIVDEDAVKKHFARTGEIPPGCVVKTSTKYTPARTMFKVNDNQVKDQCKAQVIAAIVRVLEEA